LNDKFLVFPLAVMDFCYLNTQNRLVILKEIINTCIKNNSILVINWHNDCFNEMKNPVLIKRTGRLLKFVWIMMLILIHCLITIKHSTCKKIALIQ
jgi:hypothetical protein